MSRMPGAGVGLGPVGAAMAVAVAATSGVPVDVGVSPPPPQPPAASAKTRRSGASVIAGRGALIGISGTGSASSSDTASLYGAASRLVNTVWASAGGPGAVRRAPDDDAVGGLAARRHQRAMGGRDLDPPRA